MEKSPPPYDQILSERCAICQQCCTEGVPEGICGFNTIELILSKKIPEKLIEQLVLYRVPEDQLDYYAIKWWHFPFPDMNLLKNMTVPSDNIYEFLAIPYAHDRCLFLGASGCQYPEGKPFDCAMFPFHFELGEFREELWCELTCIIKNVETVQRHTRKSISDYRLYSQQHRNEYAQNISQLKQRFQFAEINLK